MSAHRRPGWVRRFLCNTRNAAAFVAVDLVGEGDVRWVDASGSMSHDQGKRVILKTISVNGMASTDCLLVLQSVEDPTGTPIYRDLMTWAFSKNASGDFPVIESHREFPVGIPLALRASSAIARTAKLRLLLRNGTDSGDVTFASCFDPASKGYVSVVVTGEWGGYADSDWDTGSIPV